MNRVGNRSLQRARDLARSEAWMDAVILLENWRPKSKLSDDALVKLINDNEEFSKIEDVKTQEAYIDAYVQTILDVFCKEGIDLDNTGQCDKAASLADLNL